MPNTENVEPNREKLLSASEEPKLAKSKTDREAPNRDIENTENVEPNRPKLLSDNDAPNCK
jgi:hypothetical protein